MWHKDNKPDTSDCDPSSGPVYVPSSAILNDSTTTGRTKPDQICAAGYYVVPYTWNGFDDRPNFAAHMFAATSANHYKAGDADESQEISYSGPGVSDWDGSPFFGVDCSGFVSRCWGLTTKESTRSLVDPSRNLVLSTCLANVQQGDIMDLPGTHVRMFIDATTTLSSTGFYKYEESIGSRPEGIQINPYRFSDLFAQGYAQYRYANATATASCAIVAYCPRNDTCP